MVIEENNISVCSQIGKFNQIHIFAYLENILINQVAIICLYIYGS